MGRLGSSPSAGCMPLGDHVLGMWVAFQDDLALGAGCGRGPALALNDGVGARDAKTLGALLVGEAFGAPDVVFAAGKLLADGVDIADAWVRASATQITMSDGVSLGELARAMIGLATSGGVAMRDAARYGVEMATEDGVALADMARHKLGKALIEALVLQDASRTAMGKTTVDGVELGETGARLLGKALIEALALSGGAWKSMAKPVGDALLLSDARASSICSVLWDAVIASDAKRLGEIVLGEALKPLDLTFDVGKSVTDGVALSDEARLVLALGLTLYLWSEELTLSARTALLTLSDRRG